jgi:hypothetical protein
MTSRRSFCDKFACFRKPISCVVVELFRVENCMLLLELAATKEILEKVPQTLAQIVVVPED